MAAVPVSQTEASVHGKVAITRANLRCLAEWNLNGRQIKNLLRTTQAVIARSGESLDYDVLKRVSDTVHDFGDLEGACECQFRKMGYYGGGNRADPIQIFRTIAGEQAI